MAKLEPRADGQRLTITLVYSPAARQVREWTLSLAADSSVAQALELSGIFIEFPALQLERLMLGIWGAKVSAGQRLSDQDRIEIYRGLRVDPKVARRERFNRQGTKSAGLFAKSRPGAKQGY